MAALLAYYLFISDTSEPDGEGVESGTHDNALQAEALISGQFWLVSLPDIDGNGFPELAVLSGHHSDGRVMIQVKDASTGLLVKNVWYSDTYRPLALLAIPDVNGNGASELCVLSADWDAGKVVVQIKDASTGLLVKNIWLSGEYEPLALEALPDLNGNGFCELAVLSRHGDTKNTVVQVYDSSSGLPGKNVSFGVQFEPLTLKMLADINGNGFPELAVLSWRWDAGKVVAQVKDSFTGLLVKNVSFSDMYTPLGLDVVPDINGNGLPELTVLSRHSSTGKVVLQVKDSFTGLLINNIWYSDKHKPLVLRVLPDVNGNGASELGVLSTDRSDRKVVVQVKDSFTGLSVKNVWFSGECEPMALEMAPDINGNGFQELAVLSLHSSTGKLQVQVKDSLTGLLVKNIQFQY